MQYYFFDAAGDPGFKFSTGFNTGGSKPFYVLAIISIENKTLITSALAELRTTFRLKPDFEFKFHRLDVDKREPFFQRVSKIEFKAYVSVLDKKRSLRTPELSKMGGNVITNTLVAPLLSKAIAEATPPVTSFHFTVDELEHNKQVTQAMRAEISKELRRQNLDCVSKVSPRDSQKEECLQLADMVAGMVMHSYETKDRTLYKIMEKRISLTEV